MSGPQQFSFFEDQPPRPAGAPELVVRAAAGRVLTKAQRAFNRLGARIEELRGEIEQQTRRLDAALAAYVREVVPRQARLTVKRKDLVRALAEFLGDKRLRGARQQAALRQMILEQLERIQSAEGELAEPDLRAIHARVEEPSPDFDDEPDLDEFYEQMAALSRTLGFKFERDDWRPGMTMDEVRARMQEIIAREAGAPRPPHTAAAETAADDTTEAAAEAAPQSTTPKRPTKRQAEKAERLRQADELRKKSVSAIYKQLAKVLHPDLERDPARKQTKTRLMQELTTAYNAGDLHTLLRLELEWIHGEEVDLARLTDEKLTIYNALLREQVAELEQALRAVAQHPRYLPLAEPDEFFGLRLRLDAKTWAREVNELIHSLDETLRRLRAGGPVALAELREAIEAWRRSLS